MAVQDHRNRYRAAMEADIPDEQQFFAPVIEPPKLHVPSRTHFAPRPRKHVWVHTHYGSGMALIAVFVGVFTVVVIACAV